MFRNIVKSRTKLLVGVGLGVGTTGVVAATVIPKYYHHHHHPQKKNNTVQQLLIPDSQGDTYEMGLYLTSKREWDTQNKLQRQSKLKNSSSFSSNWYRLKYFTQDHLIIPLQTLFRFLQLTCFVVIPILCSYPLTYLSPHYNISWYKLIKSLCQFAGPSFIKLGQWASSRNDLFPQEFCHIMSTLHSNVKPHPLEYSKQMLRDLFDTKNLEEIFDTFDDLPLGCGSIAQVHRATWKEHSESSQVAIKILHPNVHNIINTDLKIMYWLAKLVDYIPTMEWLSLRDEVRNFSILMNMQLDLRIEALNLAKFNQDFSRDNKVKFPQPDLFHTTRSILFEEYLEALPMEWFLRVKTRLNGNDTLQISHPFVMTFLKMMILNNFVHTDLHPGNVMIRFINKTTYKPNKSIINNLQKRYGTNEFIPLLKDAFHDHIPQICLIDVGLVTQLNDRNRINFMDLFQSLTRFDGYKAGQLMIERSRTPQTAIDPHKFSLRVQDLVTTIKKQTFSLGSISIGNLLNEMLLMVRQHHVKMEADFVSIVVAIFLLEGIGRQLDPNLDLFESSIPLLTQYYKERHPILLLGQDKAGTVMDPSLFHDTKAWQMMMIWLGLQTRRLLNVSLRQTDLLLKSDQLSPNY